MRKPSVQCTGMSYPIFWPTPVAKTNIGALLCIANIPWLLAFGSGGSFALFVQLLGSAWFHKQIEPFLVLDGLWSEKHCYHCCCHFRMRSTFVQWIVAFLHDLKSFPHSYCLQCRWVVCCQTKIAQPRRGAQLLQIIHIPVPCALYLFHVQQKTTNSYQLLVGDCMQPFRTASTNASPMNLQGIFPKHYCFMFAWSSCHLKVVFPIILWSVTFPTWSQIQFKLKWLHVHTHMWHCILFLVHLEIIFNSLYTLLCCTEIVWCKVPHRKNASLWIGTNVIVLHQLPCIPTRKQHKREVARHPSPDATIAQSAFDIPLGSSQQTKFPPKTLEPLLCSRTIDSVAHFGKYVQTCQNHTNTNLQNDEGSGTAWVRLIGVKHGFDKHQINEQFIHTSCTGWMGATEANYYGNKWQTIQNFTPVRKNKAYQCCNRIKPTLWKRTKTTYVRVTSAGTLRHIALHLFAAHRILFVNPSSAPRHPTPLHSLPFPSFPFEQSSSFHSMSMSIFISIPLHSTPLLSTPFHFLSIEFRSFHSVPSHYIHSVSYRYTSHDIVKLHYSNPSMWGTPCICWLQKH